MKVAIFMVILLALSAFAGIDRGPILSSEQPHCEMVANFRTESLCWGELHYRELPDGGWRIVTDTCADTLHYLKMTVHPYLQCEYFVLADGDSLGPYTFWTAPMPGEARDLDFCAYGDTRTGLIQHWVIIDHIMACDPMFVLVTGDMIEDGEDNDDWDLYFAELCEWHDIAQSVPYFYAMGNHDDEAPYFYNAVTLPQNTEGTEAYYSFDWGRIHFTIINSEIDYDLLSPQYAFLAGDLAEASANPNYDFVIPMVHRPFYSSGYHGREEEMAGYLEPLLVANQVDLVLQGHDHMYERTYPQDGVRYIVTGGGGAPPSPIFYWYDWTAYGYNLYHHLDFHYDASEAKLSMYMHNYADDIVDSLILYSTPVGVRESALPEKLAFSVHPNPFNTDCTITVKGSDNIDRIKIYDVSGNFVRDIPLSPAAGTAGHIFGKGFLGQPPADMRALSATWDGTDALGNPVPGGIYLIQVPSGTVTANKLVLLK